MAVYNQNKNNCKHLKKFAKDDLEEAPLKWMKAQRNVNLPPVSYLLLKI